MATNAVQHYVVAITLLSLAVVVKGHCGDDRAAVEKVLRESVGRHVIARSSDLPPLRDPLAVLATFLADYDLGNEAGRVMLEINPDEAAPLLFASMPRANRGAQVAAFSLFNLRVREGEDYPLKRQMHDAAVRCLEDKTGGSAANLALYAVGLTGTKADYPLLERYATNQHRNMFWRTELRQASEAALARLGHPQSIQVIEDKLKKPVLATISIFEAEQLADLMEQAAFAKDARLLPLLCAHLDDPQPPEDGDYRHRSTAGSAAAAMQEILKGPLKPKEDISIEFWKKWCADQIAKPK